MVDRGEIRIARHPGTPWEIDGEVRRHLVDRLRRDEALGDIAEAFDESGKLEKEVVLTIEQATALAAALDGWWKDDVPGSTPQPLRGLRKDVGNGLAERGY